MDQNAKQPMATNGSIGKYYSPTPVRMRKIGDAILFGTTALSTLMMGAPFEERTITVIVWSLGVVGVLGKVITNFFKEDEL